MISRLISIAADRRTTTAAIAAASTAIGHSTGTNAVLIITSRPTAHAARRASRADSVNIRPAARPMSGISTNATALPSRPAETAPKATGSSA